MTNLKKSILYLVFLLTFIFNIERLDVGGENTIDIQSFLYVLIFLMVITHIASRKFFKFSTGFVTASWVGIYFLLKLTVFNEHPLLGNFYTYLTITEITLLTVSVLLTDLLANTLTEYEAVIEKVTFPHDGRVMEMTEAQGAMSTEFARSRRHGRSLSLVVVEMAPHTNKFLLERTVKNIQQAMFNRFLFASLAKVLSEEARRTDLIIEQGDNQFILLCPETTTTGSRKLVERVQELAVEKLGITVKCGVASFPDEALTFDDLKKRAYSRIHFTDEPTLEVELTAEPDKEVDTVENLLGVKTDQQS